MRKYIIRGLRYTKISGVMLNGSDAVYNSCNVECVLMAPDKADIKEEVLRVLAARQGIKVLKSIAIV